jgi:hypothetical protein
MANSTKKEFFRAREVISACEAAIASSDPGERPLAKIFSIGTRARPGPQGVQYLDVYCTLPEKKPYKLRLQIVNEKHSGRIDPLDESVVHLLNQTLGENRVPFKKRDRKPQISIQKYATYIRTDQEGKPEEPLPEEQRSGYFRVIEYLNEFFNDEINRRLKDNKIGIFDARLAATYPPDFITAKNVKVVSMIQSHCTPDPKNPTKVMPLANPISRISMSFDKNNMPRKAQFFDGTKRGGTNNTFEPLLFDGCPVTANNIHNLASRSIVSGIVDLGSVCLSNMGISLLAELELVVVCPPVREESISLADAFSEDELNMLAPLGVSEATATVQEQLILNGPVVPQEPLEQLLEGLNIP